MAALQLKMEYTHGDANSKASKTFEIPDDEATNNLIKNFAEKVGTLFNNYTKVANSKIETTDLDAE